MINKTPWYLNSATPTHNTDQLRLDWLSVIFMPSDLFLVEPLELPGLISKIKFNRRQYKMRIRRVRKKRSFCRGMHLNLF